MKPVRLFSSDLDGTLLGIPSGTQRFKLLWEQLDPQSRPLLVYNSGRLLADIGQLIPETGLPEPDFVIGGVGTMLHSPHRPALGTAFTAELDASFDSAVVAGILTRTAGVIRQPDEYQHRHKSSWYLHDAGVDVISGIEAELTTAGQSVRIVYSSNRDLDVLPYQCHKGAALSWLCDRLGIGPDETLAAGDTDNDRGMLTVPQVRSIVVGNALPELKALGAKPLTYLAKGHAADGVIEGLQHWGVFQAR